jgi:gliding motility-associated-like protein
MIITINQAATVNAGVDQTICSNSSVSLNGAFGGIATDATWSGGTGTLSPDITSLNATYTPSAAEINAGTVTLTLTTNDPVGPCAAVSDQVVITIDSIPTANAGLDQSICAGTDATLAGIIGGVATSITWIGGSGTFNPDNITLNAVYTPSAAEIIAGSVTLTMTTNDPSGPCFETSDLITIEIRPDATVGNLPNIEICSKDTLNIPLNDTINVSYTWIAIENPNTSGESLILQSSNVISDIITSDALSIQQIIYEIIPTNRTTLCSGPMSTYNVSIKPLPDLILSQSFDSICLGDLSQQINFSSSIAGTTFSWSGIDTSNLGISPFNDNGDSIPPFLGTNNGLTPLTDSIIVTSFNNGCIGQIDTITYVLNPMATASTDSLNYQYCSGESIAIEFLSTISNSTFSWVNENLNTGIDASDSGDSLIVISNNSTLVNQNSNIVLTPYFNGCPGQDYTFTILVKPIPNVQQTGDISYCNDVYSTPITFQGTYGNSTIFQWTNSNVAISANGNIDLPESGNGNFPSFLTINSELNTVIDSVIVRPILNGCVGERDTFLIKIQPVTLVFPIDTSICSGTQLSNICFNGSIPEITFNWNSDNISIGIEDDGVDCIPNFTSAASAPNIQLANVVISPIYNGCPGVKDTMRIYVKPIPTLSSTADTSICHNVFLDSIIFDSDVDFSDISWGNNNSNIGLLSHGDGNLDSFIGLNVNANDISAEIVVFAVANGCQALNDTFNIVVHPLPTVEAGNDTILCLGQCVFLEATGNGINPPLDYSWDNGGVQNQNYCPNDSVNMHVTVTDLYNCKNVDSIQIIFNNILPPVVDAGPNDAICLRDDYTLSGSGDLNVDYLWNNGVINNQPFSPNETDTYTVIGTSSITGCSSIDSMILVVNPLPNVTIFTADSVLCIGETANLLANGALNYQWLSGPSTPDYSFIPNLTDVYAVVGFNEFGCSDTAKINVSVNPYPVPIIDSDMNYGGCLPFSPTFTDLTGTNGNGPESASVLWDFGNGITSNQLGTVAGNYQSFGCYDITFTSISAVGCSTTIMLQNYACVNEIIANFTSFPSEQQITNPVFEFQNQSINATSFEWDFGDSTSNSYQTHPSHSYENVGEYTVILIASAQDGCSDTAVNVIRVKDDVLIYVPNTFTPDGDGLNEVFIPMLLSGYDRNKGYEFKIYNRWGENIFSTFEAGVGWDGTFQGKPVQDGTYTWIINFKSSANNEIFNYSGHIILLR